jgi:maltose alpha-D-glucosyltransferase/alpha-amylase
MSTLKQLLISLYDDAAEKIIQELEADIGEVADSKDSDTVSDWYKRMNLYVTYPDSFCTEGSCDLAALTSKISHIKKLGCNAIHVLPFFESPMIDLGFDISNYKKVRDQLGGNEAFEEFLKKSKDNDIRVFVDIVLNHISFEHEWFKKAVGGDERFRNFFIWRETKPEFIKSFEKDGKTWARYIIDGKERDVFVIFPDHAGDVPHWIQAEDGNWYYHTFYPHQIDVDWNNPEVFFEFAKILAYWARKGVSFRLDAIPFIGKNIEEGRYTDDLRTQQVVQALHEVVRAVSSESVFLSEVAFELEKIKTYFGNKDIIESELSYNFPLNANFWLSLITGNPDHIWNNIEAAFRDIPDWAHWVNFIRNHDALMIDRMRPEDKELIFDALDDAGLPFANGTNISGRTFSFLQEDPKRVVFAYFLLASLPGSPAVIYGDEVGKKNDFPYMKKMVDWKRNHLNDSGIVEDTRDISRGHIVDEDIKSDVAIKIFDGLASILNTRSKVSDSMHEVPKRLDSPPCILALEYKDLIVYTNLADKPIELELDHDKGMLLECNEVEVEDSMVKLGAYSGVWFRC